MTDDKLYLLAVSAARRKINMDNKIDTKIEVINGKLEELKIDVAIQFTKKWAKIDTHEL